MKLKIEVGRYREVVFGRILEQEGIERKSGLVADLPDGFAVHSALAPELDWDRLFVRGSKKHADGRTMSYRLDSEDEAIAYIEKLRNAVRAVNRQGTEPAESRRVYVEVLE